MSWTAGLWTCSQIRYRWGHSGIYLINIKKENMLYGPRENFHIEFRRISQQAFAYKIFFIWSGDLLFKSML